MQVLTQEQVNILLEDIKDTPLFIPVLLAVTCGMRRGEILALKWANIDFDKKTIYISNSLIETDGEIIMQDPKTETSRRTIYMPDVVIKALKEHKKKQAQNKLMLGQNYNDDDFVCCWDNGQPFRPDFITHAFTKVLKKLNLPHVRFHDLRHTHVTLLLQQDVHPKIVQERLGHSSISMTLDTYSHVLPNMQQEAANRIDELIK